MPYRLSLLILTVAIILVACETPSPTISPTLSPAAEEPPATRESPATREPTATPEPTHEATRIDTTSIVRDPVTEADRANAEAIGAADLPIGDLRDLAIRFRGLPADTPEKTCVTAREYQVGDREVFHVSNNNTFEQFDVTAVLVSKQPNVYMWVDNSWLEFVDRDVVVATGQELDQKIIPRDRELFGMEWSPGIDCDTRLHVLHTSNTGAGGYFTSPDQYIAAVRPDSNEKEMFYIDLEGIGELGGSYYLGGLAHEFQHMIHFHADRNEDTWANEGLSELAAFLNGYGLNGHDMMFAEIPNIQLNFWPEGGGEGVHYGTTFTFWLYFYDKYGEQGIREFIADPRNGLDGVARALQEAGFRGPLDEFFADWVVAKFLDNPLLADGRYGFEKSDPPLAAVAETVERYPYQFEQPGQVSQYAAQYFMFLGDNDLRVDFAGSTKARMIDAEPHAGQYFWWSNRGDYADMRLTREIDLSGVSEATLTYWTWFDTEEDWDYGYVTVSEDGGKTFKTLRTPSSTDRDPNGNNLGWGYTGNSDGDDSPRWIQESVDLTPYAGRKVLLRFETVNDLAVHLPGFALDDVEIPEIGFTDDAETDTGWTAEGWVRTNNFVPQNFIVQMIGYGKDGATTVTRLPLDDDNTGAWDIPLNQLNSAVLIVAATAVKSSEPALFNWMVAEK